MRTLPCAARRALLRQLLLAGVAGAALSSHPVRAQDAGTAEKRQRESSDGGLLRLAMVLEKQLQRRKAALPLPWRESILTPATARLVWYPRSLTAPRGGGTFRVGFDPLTRWYFVAQVTAGKPRPRFFGPLEEAGKGVFVDAFPAPSAAASPAGRKGASP